MLISDFIENARESYPNNEAVVCNDIRLTYVAFYDRCKNLAAYLQRQGIKKGDVISIIHHNCHCFMEAYFAAAWCGAILSPINVRLSPREIQYILNDSGSKVLIANQRYTGQLEKVNHLPETIVWTGKDLPQSLSGCFFEDVITDVFPSGGYEEIHTNEEDIAHLYYTSGTTGKPKGVPLSHRNVTAHSLSAIEELGISHEDNWLHAAPLFHLADAWATFAFTHAGAKHTMLSDFREKEAFALIEKEGVTVSNMIPTMLNMLVHFKDIGQYDLSSLRLMLSGGAPIAPQLVRKVIEKFRCDYMQTYGMTETSPYLTISKLKEHMMNLPFEMQLRYKEKTGRAFSGVSLRVVTEDGNDVAADGTEVGEIIVKGDTITRGYWGLPEETSRTIKDGWLYTGDLATIDEEGYVNIVDRKKDLIITGGENVYSTEVENVIYEHPAVLEVAVIGIPDDTWGEAVKAFVVKKEGHEINEADVILFVKERIAHFKAPKLVTFVDALPKTGSGKVMKQALKRQIVNSSSR